MDYKKHYEYLIAKRGLQTKPSTGYYERHHIVPKSMGGSNDPSNLVYLTAREHFIAHWLLWKIYNNKETAFAFKSMTMSRKDSGSRFITSKGFSIAREAAAKYMSEHNPMKKSEVSSKFKGDKNPMRRPEVAAKFKGDKNPMKRAEVSAKVSGKKCGKFKGTVIAESLDGKVIIEMEGTKDIKSYGFHPGNVSSCLSGNRKTHKGYTFTRIKEQV